MSQPEKSKQIAQKMAIRLRKIDISFEDTKHKRQSSVVEIKEATYGETLRQ